MSAGRDRLVEAIKRGGSVLHQGNLIHRVKDLPSEHDLASPSGKLAIEARKREEEAAAKTAVNASKKPTKKAVVEEEEEDED